MPRVRREFEVTGRVLSAVALAVVVGCDDGGGRVEYTQGHADILIDLVVDGDANSMEALLLAGGATIDGDVITGAVSLRDISIRSRARFIRPDDDMSAFARVCAASGEAIGWLPQGLRDANEGDAPFLGIAASFDEADVDGGTVELSLVSVHSPTGHGEYSLWQDGFPPRFFLSTCDGGDEADRLELGPGHDHYNMGFTEPGVWTVQYRASATIARTGQPVQVDFEVVYVLE